MRTQLDKVKQLLRSAQWEFSHSMMSGDNDIHYGSLFHRAIGDGTYLHLYVNRETIHNPQAHVMQWVPSHLL